MKPILEGMLFVLLGVLIAIGSSIVKPVYQIADHIAAITGDVRKTLHGTHKNGDDGLLFRLNMLVKNADSFVNQIKQTSESANLIAKEQRTKSLELSAATVDAVESVKPVIAKLDSAADSLGTVLALVGKETVPKLNAGVDQVNGLVGDLRPVAKSATELIDQGTTDLKELQATETKVNALLDSPDLVTMRQNFTLASTRLLDFQVSLNHSMVEVDQTMGYVRDFAKPKPTNATAWIVGLIAKGVGGPIAGALVSHFLPTGIDVKNAVKVSQ